MSFQVFETHADFALIRRTIFKSFPRNALGKQFVQKPLSQRLLASAFNGRPEPSIRHPGGGWPIGSLWVKRIHGAFGFSLDPRPSTARTLLLARCGTSPILQPPPPITRKPVGGKLAPKAPLVLCTWILFSRTPCGQSHAECHLPHFRGSLSVRLGLNPCVFFRSNLYPSGFPHLRNHGSPHSY